MKALETAAKHIHSIIGVRCPSKNFKAGCITFLFSTSAALSPPGIYVRSSLLQKGDGVLQLQQARHPCVELIDGVNFIPNDYDLKKGTSDEIPRVLKAMHGHMPVCNRAKETLH